jgi:DNA-binding transcriptional LysR family regulator
MFRERRRGCAAPILTIQLYSLTTAEIYQRIDDFSLDAGVTYLESDVFRPAAIEAHHIYDERYVLLAPTEMAPRRQGFATWAEAAAMPLCLLTRNMRNRRFLDGVFERAVGASPHLVMETDDFTALLAQVATGVAATVAPEVLADTLPFAWDAVRLPLVAPEIATPIGLLVNERDPFPPAILAFVQALRATIAEA